MASTVAGEQRAGERAAALASAAAARAAFAAAWVELALAARAFCDAGAAEAAAGTALGRAKEAQRRTVARLRELQGARKCAACELPRECCECVSADWHWHWE